MEPSYYRKKIAKIQREIDRQIRVGKVISSYNERRRMWIATRRWNRQNKENEYD